ncbi:MAG: protein-glutamate O-methyltransferase CheR [Methanosarcina sp.]|uniref:CheR family methyltransferase n=1 Tax=Methanosarcina sp. TaxID=2213 RepID=UPI00260FCEA9|nr:protein-glutamate O-methyltransferase CheR [Methanosarcina sp.]MDD3248718.1 protein-glutamate O-methyltransferase CheR [Methanosarcina sp.]MDD4250367.1 protein-glutamate O-methyltransferase CheR [Methanosarcina sp.]
MVVNIDDDFNFLVRKISKSSGIILAGYRDSYLRRRIDLRMKAVGADNYTTYTGLLEKNQTEMKEIINALTVNVTEFMRDKTPFMFFREEILPDIMERKKKSKSNLVRFWSAACSNGEEPYSIGICSKDVLPEDWSISIYATDIDEKCLKHASQGIYSKDQIKNLDSSLIRKYFEPAGEGFKIKSIQKLLIRFQKHDLTSEPPISKHFDAVFCRNVMIYFNENQKIKMLNDFYNSLSDDGYLIIGKSETLPGEIRGLFTPVSAKEKVFKKV